MYFWITFFIWTLFILWTGMIVIFVFEPRWSKIPDWILPIVFTIISLPCAYLKITHSGTQFGEIMFGLAIVQVIAYLLLFFKNRLWQKILFFLLYLAIGEIGDIICTVLMVYLGKQIDFSFNSMEMSLLVAADFAIILILSGLLLLAWNHFITHKATVQHIWLFFVFPISQMIILFSVNGKGEKNLFYGDLLCCIGIILGFLADFILLYILMGQAQKEELKKQLQELESLRQLENVHYQLVEAKRSEMSKIRHDFNNQLMTAYHLMEQEDKKQSRSLLDALRNDIARTTESLYCNNAIINAVINEKVAVCQTKGICIETELALEEEPLIQPVHFCSIFSNLMDNAIRAAQDCLEGERFIRVKAAHKGDYIHIKVENSALEPKKLSANERKHYGQEILKDIAAQYNGAFRGEWKDGMYQSVVSLTVDS